MPFQLNDQVVLKSSLVQEGVPADVVPVGTRGKLIYKEVFWGTELSLIEWDVPESNQLHSGDDHGAEGRCWWLCDSSLEEHCVRLGGH